MQDLRTTLELIDAVAPDSKDGIELKKQILSQVLALNNMALDVATVEKNIAIYKQITEYAHALKAAKNLLPASDLPVPITPASAYRGMLEEQKKQQEAAQQVSEAASQVTIDEMIVTV